MRANSIIYPGLGYGLISGVILGLFFKWIEYTGIADVYTLLLNVDFVPQLPQPLPEWFEFSLHLIVSLVIGIMFCALMSWRRKALMWGLLMGIAPIPLFIPLTLLSDRTPAIDDFSALTWWIIGHVIYGLSLSLLSLQSRKT